MNRLTHVLTLKFLTIFHNMNCFSIENIHTTAYLILLKSPFLLCLRLDSWNHYKTRNLNGCTFYFAELLNAYIGSDHILKKVKKKPITCFKHCWIFSFKSSIICCQFIVHESIGGLIVFVLVFYLISQFTSLYFVIILFQFYY